MIGAGLGAAGGAAGAADYADENSDAGAVGIGVAGVAAGAALGWAMCRVLWNEPVPELEVERDTPPEALPEPIVEAPPEPEVIARVAPVASPINEPEPAPPVPEPPIPGPCAETIELPGLFFAVGQAVIRLDSYDTLDLAIERLILCQDERVRVDGHTDATGSADLNQRLSEERARSVRTYLVEAGIDPERVTSAGFGGSRPIAENDTGAGRARNRRVEIRFPERDESATPVR